MKNIKLGIDVGGTFTDFIQISEDGKTSVHKTLSSPHDPSISVINGIKELADDMGLSLPDFISKVDTIVHGTTVATNALLTLRGAKTALVTTEGFRDALEMRRGVREEQYNNHYKNVVPLVPRYLRLPVKERVDARGNILVPLDEAGLYDIISKLKAEKVQSVAICFMNSFKNDRHEKRAAVILRKELPECFITASTEVLPSIRFYKRLSTTAVNAYIGPVVANYLDNLMNKLNNIHFTGSLLIMQSNGGVLTPEFVKKCPAVTVLSGPAAAPTAGVYYANLLGYTNCITIDMGGTSFDASLIVENQCLTSTDTMINRYKIGLPSLDIITIGAGGGSIGWIDKGGLLQMGPQSAGALPGPVCYNIGGDLPTCTDANVLLGYLNPEFFAGGRIKLNTAKAEEIIKEKLADKLHLTPQEAAAGMFRIINSNMAQGVRQISIEKGHDPREFLIIVAGGAGAIHSSEICKELEIPMFMVPNVSSIFCAAGMLLGDLKHDYIRSFLSTFSEMKAKDFIVRFEEMKKEGESALLNEGVKKDNIEFFPMIDLRYDGQYHEVQLDVPWETITNFNLPSIKTLFHQEHNRLFGYSLDDSIEIEIINLRLRVIGKMKKPEFLKGDEVSIPSADALKQKRNAYIPETNSYQEIPVYDGDKRLTGHVIQGPAIIEKVNTSILVTADYDCFVDNLGSFIVYDKKVYPNGFITKRG